MSRFPVSSVLSFSVLAAGLVVSGCGGGSSSDSTPHTGVASVASLNGTYAFQEQVYTYYAESEVAKKAVASGKFSGHKLDRIDHLAHLTPAKIAALNAKTRSAAKGVKPEQGDLNSAVAWGAEIGSLTFDGNGNITAGELDFNEPTLTGYFTENVTGNYTVGTDQVGTIALQGTGANSGDTYAYQITLQGAGVSTGAAATGAQLLEGVSDNVGDVEIGTGQVLQQSAGSDQGSLKGNYVFGLQGQTCYGCLQAAQGDVFAAGLLSADGAGNFAAGSEADLSTGFATDNQVALAGTYAAPDTYGKVTAALTATGYVNGTLPAGYSIYIVNPSTAFLLSTDQSGSTLAAGFLYGQLGLQTGTFTNASLTGNFVVAETTEDLANESLASADDFSDTYLALLTATGGTLNGSGDINQAGNVSSAVAFNYGTYTVAANGRVTFNGTTPTGAPAPVFWLQSAGIGYGVDQLGTQSTPTQEPGLLYLYQQSSSTSFSTGSLNGTYALGNLPSAVSDVGENLVTGTETVGFVNGDLVADGNGNLTGDGSVVFITGDGGSGSLAATYTVASNGRGTITGTGGSNGIFTNEVVYFTASGQALGTDVTPGDSAPSIQVIQQ